MNQEQELYCKTRNDVIDLLCTKLKEKNHRLVDQVKQIGSFSHCPGIIDFDFINAFEMISNIKKENRERKSQTDQEKKSDKEKKYQMYKIYHQLDFDKNNLHCDWDNHKDFNKFNFFAIKNFLFRISDKHLNASGAATNDILSCVNADFFKHDVSIIDLLVFDHCKKGHKPFIIFHFVEDIDKLYKGVDYVCKTQLNSVNALYFVIFDKKLNTKIYFRYGDKIKDNKIPLNQTSNRWMTIAIDPKATDENDERQFKSWENTPDSFDLAKYVNTWQNDYLLNFKKLDYNEHENFKSDAVEMNKYKSNDISKISSFTIDILKMLSKNNADKCKYFQKKPNNKDENFPLLKEMCTRRFKESKYTTRTGSIFQLRYYQIGIINDTYLQLMENLKNNSTSRFLWEMATGTGKTLTALVFIISLMYYGIIRRPLILVDRKELLDQIYNSFRDLALLNNYEDNNKNTIFNQSHELFKFVKEISKSAYSQYGNNESKSLNFSEHIEENKIGIYFMTINKCQHLLDIPFSKDCNPNVLIHPYCFDFLLFDEVHRVFGETRTINFSNLDVPIWVGLTATPKRNLYSWNKDETESKVSVIEQTIEYEQARKNSQEIEKLFSNKDNAFQYDHVKGIIDGYLVPTWTSTTYQLVPKTSERFFDVADKQNEISKSNKLIFSNEKPLSLYEFLFRAACASTSRRYSYLPDSEYIKVKNGLDDELANMAKQHSDLFKGGSFITTEILKDYTGVKIEDTKIRDIDLDEDPYANEDQISNKQFNKLKSNSNRSLNGLKNLSGIGNCLIVEDNYKEMFKNLFDYPKNLAKEYFKIIKNAVQDTKFPGDWNQKKGVALEKEIKKLFYESRCASEKKTGCWVLPDFSMPIYNLNDLFNAPNDEFDFIHLLKKNDHASINYDAPTNWFNKYIDFLPGKTIIFCNNTDETRWICDSFNKLAKVKWNWIYDFADEKDKKINFAVPVTSVKKLYEEWPELNHQHREIKNQDIGNYYSAAFRKDNMQMTGAYYGDETTCVVDVSSRIRNANQEYFDDIFLTRNDFIQERGKKMIQILSKNDSQVSYLASKKQEKILLYQSLSDLTRVCVAKYMMTTGYDCTDLLNIVFYRHIQSATNLIQMIGRGTRTYSFKSPVYNLLKTMDEEISKPNLSTAEKEANVNQFSNYNNVIKFQFKLIDYFYNYHLIESYYFPPTPKDVRLIRKLNVNEKINHFPSGKAYPEKYYAEANVSNNDYTNPDENNESLQINNRNAKFYKESLEDFTFYNEVKSDLTKNGDNTSNIEVADSFYVVFGQRFQKKYSLEEGVSVEQIVKKAHNVTEFYTGVDIFPFIISWFNSKTKNQALQKDESYHLIPDWIRANWKKLNLKGTLSNDCIKTAQNYANYRKKFHRSPLTNQILLNEKDFKFDVLKDPDPMFVNERAKVRN